MADPTTFQEITVRGVARFPGGMEPPLARASLRQDSLQSFTIPMTSFRVYDAMHTLSPGTPAWDDLGLVGDEVVNTGFSLQTQDEKSFGAARSHLSGVLYPMPIEYVQGGLVRIRLHAGMVGAIADVSAACIVNVNKSDEELGVGAELVVGGGQSCNSLAFADYDFTVEPATLVPGDLLNIRLAVLLQDNATGTPVIAAIGSVKLLCDVKG